jgi:hypothetical protein
VTGRWGGSNAATPEEVARCVEMDAAGASLGQIARALGRGESWVSRIRRKRRDEQAAVGGRPGKPGVGALEAAEIQRMTLDGYSSAWIGWLLDRDPAEVRRYRSLRGWYAPVGTPRRTHTPPSDGLPWGQREVKAGRPKLPRGPERVSLPVVVASGPLPVRDDRGDGSERDPWCRRAMRCIDAILDHCDPLTNPADRWRGFSCRACPIAGTDQEDTEARLSTLALAQAIAPEVGPSLYDARKAGAARWYERKRAQR